MNVAVMAEVSAWLLLGAGTVFTLIWHAVAFLEFVSLFRARRPWQPP